MSGPGMDDVDALALLGEEAIVMEVFGAPAPVGEMLPLTAETVDVEDFLLVSRIKEDDEPKIIELELLKAEVVLEVKLAAKDEVPVELPEDDKRVVDTFELAVGAIIPLKLDILELDVGVAKTEDVFENTPVGETMTEDGRVEDEVEFKYPVEEALLDLEELKVFKPSAKLPPPPHLPPQTPFPG